MQWIPSLSVEITPWTIPLRYEINEGSRMTGMWMQHCLPIPTSFLMERIQIIGLASDALHGNFKLTHAGTGRLYIDSPLWWYAIRSRRVLKPQLFFGVGSCITVQISFKESEGIGTGFDLLGNERKKRIIEVLLIGQCAKEL